jgi:hypothetical protein
MDGMILIYLVMCVATGGDGKGDGLTEGRKPWMWVDPVIYKKPTQKITKDHRPNQTMKDTQPWENGGEGVGRQSQRMS